MSSASAHLARTGLRARPFVPRDAPAWDAFVASCPAGTMLHTRAFLSYHGTRFRDCSLLFVDAADTLRAVMPAATDPDDTSGVVSHPGATYGGILLPRRASGADAVAVLECACSHLAGQGYTRLLYRSVPPHLHGDWSQADLYALWRGGARLYRRDLWSVLELGRPRAANENRRRRLRTASARGVRVVEDGSREAYATFHKMLTQCLAERHSVAPVHSLEEMLLLASRLPGKIRLWLALNRAGDCVAGEWIFHLGVAWHQQYAATTPAGRAASAQDLLLEAIFDVATAAGVSRFSFGTSTEQQGTQLNEGLFRYKASFGSGSVVQDFYEIDLRTAA